MRKEFITAVPVIDSKKKIADIVLLCEITEKKLVGKKERSFWCACNNYGRRQRDTFISIY